MADIYAGALVTIVATVSNDSEQGVFTELTRLSPESDPGRAVPYEDGDTVHMRCRHFRNLGM